MSTIKPRICILMHYMELGGAEMALIGLLNALDPEKVDVDLFIYSHQGPLMKYIPKWVNLLPEKSAYSVIEKPMTTALKQGHFGVVAARIFAKLMHKYYIKFNPPCGDDASLLQYVGNCVTPILPKINSRINYDLCISFLNPHNIGRDKVCAKKRLAWIHTDYSIVSVNSNVELPVWSAYDKIVSISEDASKSFLNVFPSLESKILLVENILPEAYIKSRANERDAARELTGEINLLSIGRYCYAKNYDNIPDICKRIREQGLNIKWYIIGYGPDKHLIQKRIAEYGMEDHVILLGKKENPYPYIKACDIYVQPSRYEGKSVTVREAQLLCKPVAITSYTTASSQIQNGLDGVIIPLDNEGCAKGLVDFINNHNLQNNITKYLQTQDIARLSEVHKIYNLLE